MGNLWPGGAITGGIKKMKLARNILSGLCILAFLSSDMLTAMAQDSADQARSYCVKSGYLYSTSPGTNGGQGMCVFPDKSWCDCQAFFQGDCRRNLKPNILPGYVSESGSTWTQSAASICMSSGGSLRSVHTPYGDITVCAFPDGRTCDLNSLAEGRCGGDRWLAYARSWLDAP
jgi:putative hemolysin